MNIAIIYHDADFDGKMSNEVCRFHLSRLYPDAAIHSYGWDYGRPVPVPHGAADGVDDFAGYDSIYIVDLSVDELMARSELRDKIVWIDHHKSAMEKWNPKGDQKYNGGFTGYRIDGVAACRLCWQWFLKLRRDMMGMIWILPDIRQFKDRVVEEPELIRLAGEYDIWDHRDPRAKELQFGLRALDETGMTRLLKDQFEREAPGRSSILDEVVSNGASIKRYCDINNSEYAAQYSQTIQWEGLTLCALNIGQRGNSDLLLGGIKPEHDACFAWRWTGNAALVSLYHIAGKEHHDLSLIAVKHGGGGHRGACGFRKTLRELENILCVSENAVATPAAPKSGKEVSISR